MCRSSDPKIGKQFREMCFSNANLTNLTIFFYNFVIPKKIENKIMNIIYRGKENLEICSNFMAMGMGATLAPTILSTTL
jgi:hypothetical protein